MRRLASVVLIGSITVLSGCTSSPPTTEQAPEPIPATTNSTQIPTQAVSSTGLEPVLAYQPANETVLGFLEEQEGINAIGPVMTDAPAVAVYANCSGGGVLEVRIPGLGGFPISCDSGSLVDGVKNVFDVRAIEDEITVEVEGRTGQHWAVTLAETTQDTPG